MRFAHSKISMFKWFENCPSKSFTVWGLGKHCNAADIIAAADKKSKFPLSITTAWKHNHTNPSKLMGSIHVTRVHVWTMFK